MHVLGYLPIFVGAWAATGRPGPALVLLGLAILIAELASRSIRRG
jgi:hypothetical protein